MGSRGGRAVRRLPCAAAQSEATIDTSSAYQVMGHPGTAPNGYAEFSYKRKLATELTKHGYLP